MPAPPELRDDASFRIGFACSPIGGAIRRIPAIRIHDVGTSKRMSSGSRTRRCERCRRTWTCGEPGVRSAARTVRDPCRTSCPSTKSHPLEPAEGDAKILDLARSGRYRARSRGAAHLVELVASSTPPRAGSNHEARAISGTSFPGGPRGATRRAPTPCGRQDARRSGNCIRSDKTTVHRALPAR